MRYYIIAGEASGDLHGSGLVREIAKLDPEAQIRCWGGDLMSAAGAEVVKHYRDLAFMGFVEVVANLGTILRNMSFCRGDIRAFKPDVAIFIDYPGFNLPMAEFCKRQGIPTVYYISPQVWAWKEGRVKRIRRAVDRMLVILPFEKGFYERHGYPVEYVGHPLTEAVEAYRLKKSAGGSDDASWHAKEAGVQTVAMLPGSRRQEIKAKLPIMLRMVERFPECRFLLAQAPGVEDSLLDGLVGSHPRVERVKGDTYGVLLRADAAMVASGTATLETALFDVPQVVCYRGNAVSYQIAKRLIKVPYISLVNLIMGREVVRELIQDGLNERALETEMRALLRDGTRRDRIKADYASLRAMLQNDEWASVKAARAVMRLLGREP